jgi:hypothetical protein
VDDGGWGVGFWARLEGRDGGRATEFGDCVRDSHALAERGDSNFSLEDINIELEEDVPCDFLL